MDLSLTPSEIQGVVRAADGSDVLGGVEAFNLAWIEQLLYV